MNMSDLSIIIEGNLKHISIKLKNIDMSNIEVNLLDNTGNQYTDISFNSVKSTLEQEYAKSSIKTMKRLGLVPVPDMHRLNIDRGKSSKVMTLSESLSCGRNCKYTKSKVNIYLDNIIMSCIKFTNNHTSYNISSRDIFRHIGKLLAYEIGKIHHINENKFINESFSLVGKGHGTIFEERNNLVNKIIIKTDLLMFSDSYIEDVENTIWTDFMRSKYIKK